MNHLPKEFIENILSLFPEEAGYFFDSISNPSITSIRLNPSKSSDAFNNETTVEWCANAKYLSVRPSFFNDPLFHAGGFYVQESSSMFLDAIVKSLPLPSQSLALDLCASPGGKSTLLLDALPKNSLLVSNEIIKSRVNPLQENMIRWGSPFSVISNNDPKHFQKLGQVFDVILVDAPCSGEGLWRRDISAMNEWSVENVQICVDRQERILQDVLPCLKPGGFLIYSTCTFNQFENEDQVKKLIPNLQPFPLTLAVDGSVRTNDNYQFRFLPHLVMGEGLFMAVLQKPASEDHSNKFAKRDGLNFLPKKYLPQIHSWLKNPLEFDYFLENEFVFALPKNCIPMYENLRSNLYIKHAGICMGKLDKAGKLIPEHSLALSTSVHPNIPKLELSKEDAVKYLRKDNLSVQTENKEGWCLASFQNLNLGWVKVLPNRINNYYPSEYRILKDIPLA